MRLLLVDDEVHFVETLAVGLRRRGFTVDVVFRGDEVLGKVAEIDYDVVVLDRDLPGMCGDDVCRALTAQASMVRVLMLTASSTVEDLVVGLGLGADDYLAKPFEFLELIARIHALGRRRGNPTPAVFTIGDVVVEPASHRAQRGERDLLLTAREFALLVELVRADGAVISAEGLLERVWDEHTDPFTTSVRVLMSRLRAKLGEPPIIETVIGAGYRVIK